MTPSTPTSSTASSGSAPTWPPTYLDSLPVQEGWLTCYGRLPLVLVAVAPPNDLEGPGPTELVDTFTDPAAVLAAVNRLLQPRPTAADHHGRREAAASCAG
jgi:hypothetical protein